MPRRRCGEVDMGKDQPHPTLHQTPEPHPQKSHAPAITGTWSLRNREQLRKRKAETQENQTSLWLLGEQRKRKCQRTGKGYQRGQKRQRNTKLKREPQSHTEKERGQEVLVPAEGETELPVTLVTEPFRLVASPTKAVSAEHCSEVHQESIQCQEVAMQNHSQTQQQKATPEDFFPTIRQETAVLKHSSKMCQDKEEPEELSPKMCQETSVAQNNSSKVPQGMTEPEALSPKMCQETVMAQTHSSKVPQGMAGPQALSSEMCQEPTVLQEHTWKMCQDVAIPEVLSPKAGHQEMAVPKAFPCTTPGDAAGPEGCSSKAFPQSDMSEGCPLDTLPKSGRPEKITFHPDQGMAGTEGFFSETRECSVSEDVSTQTHQEAVEPEFMSQETYKEITVPTIFSHKTTQESPGPEEYSPEMCQPTPGLENYSPETCYEVLGPDDLSVKTFKKRGGPNHHFPEGAQETSGAQGQASDAHQDGEDAGTFSQEMKEKAKADQDPETPASPQGPPAICPENDIHSYAVF